MNTTVNAKFLKNQAPALLTIGLQVPLSADAAALLGAATAGDIPCTKPRQIDAGQVEAGDQVRVKDQWHLCLGNVECPAEHISERCSGILQLADREDLHYGYTDQITVRIPASVTE